MGKNRRTLGGSVVVWGTFFDQMALLPAAGKAALALGAGPVAAGLITSAPGIGSLFGNSLGGLLVDRLGPRRAMQIAVIGSVLSALGYLLPVGVAGLFLVQLIHGALTAVLNPAVYSVLSQHGEGAGGRAERMARSGISIAIASLVAAPVSLPLVARFGIAGLGPLLAVVIGLTGWLGYRLLGPALEEYHPARTPRSAGQLPWAALLVPYMAALALLFGQGLLGHALPLKAGALGLPPSITGALFSAFAAAALICFVPPVSRAGDRLPRLPVLMAGLLLALFGVASMAGAVSAGRLFQGMAAYGLGFGLLFPTMGAQVGDSAPPHMVGRAFGLFYAMFSLGGIVGPPVAGYLSGENPLAAAVFPLTAALLVTAGAWLRQRLVRPPLNHNL